MPVIDLDHSQRAVQLSVDEALQAAGEFGRGQQFQLLLVGWLGSLRSDDT
jgi:hypothetical protein